MRVILKQDWYAPGDRFFSRGPAGSIIDVPDHLAKFLPSRAVIVGEDDKPVGPQPVHPGTRSEADEARAADEALQYVTVQAEAQRERIQAKRAEALSLSGEALTPPAEVPAADTPATEPTPGRRKPRATEE